MKIFFKKLQFFQNEILYNILHCMMYVMLKNIRLVYNVYKKK